MASFGVAGGAASGWPVGANEPNAVVGFASADTPGIGGNGGSVISLLVDAAMFVLGGVIGGKSIADGSAEVMSSGNA